MIKKLTQNLASEMSQIAIDARKQEVHRRAPSGTISIPGFIYDNGTIRETAEVYMNTAFTYGMLASGVPILALWILHTAVFH